VITGAPAGIFSVITRGTPRFTAARIEIGQTSPSLDHALALSRELGESVEALFRGER
jgi:hypothetical protein